MKQEEQQNAFPALHLNAHQGMSLREYYYAAALTGLLSNSNVVKELDQNLGFMNDLCLAATLYADTLIDKGWEE
jgi:hypothetical protein